MTTAELRSLARKAQVDERTATRWLAGLPVRPAMAERLGLAQKAIAALATIDELFTGQHEGCICSKPFNEGPTTEGGAPVLMLGFLIKATRGDR